MNLKKSIVPALCTMLCFGSAKASIIDLYLGATGGMGNERYMVDGVMAGYMDDFSKSAISYGAVVGIDIPVIRLEAEYNHVDTDVLKTNLAMANVLFKVIPMPIVTPYIGFGGGMQYGGEFKGSNVDVDENWAAQGMVGLTFALPATNMKIDVEGRAVYMPDVLEDNLDTLHYEGRLKLRYQF